MLNICRSCVRKHLWFGVLPQSQVSALTFKYFLSSFTKAAIIDVIAEKDVDTGFNLIVTSMYDHILREKCLQLIGRCGIQVYT